MAANNNCCVVCRLSLHSASTPLLWSCGHVKYSQIRILLQLELFIMLLRAVAQKVFFLIHTFIKIVCFILLSCNEFLRFSSQLCKGRVYYVKGSTANTYDVLCSIEGTMTTLPFATKVEHCSLSLYLFLVAVLPHCSFSSCISAFAVASAFASACKQQQQQHQLQQQQL